MTIFEEKPETFGLIYEKRQDVCDVLFETSLIDNIDYLFGKITEINKPVDCPSGVIYFLWKKAVNAFSEDIAFRKMTEEKKQRIIDFSSKMRLNVASLIQYLNHNYSAAFDKKEIPNDLWSEYLPSLLCLCFCVFKNTLDRNVFAFLEDNFGLNILSDFDCCLSYYKKNEAYLKRLLGKADDLPLCDTSIYVSFLLKYKGKVNDDVLQSAAKKQCEKEAVFFKQYASNSDTSDIILNRDFCRQYSRLASLYRLPVGNEYKELEEKMESSLTAFIMKRGQHFRDGPYPVDGMVEFFRKDENVFRFLRITHKKENGKIANAMDSVFTISQVNSFSEISDYNGGFRSDKYPFYRQAYMNQQIWVFSRVIAEILRDNELKPRFLVFVDLVSAETDKKYFGGRENTNLELTGSLAMILNIMDMAAQKKEKTPLYKALCNGCCMNLCALIEKNVRNAFVKEHFAERYIDESSCTLRLMMKEDIPHISKSLRYYIEFFLSTESDDSIPKGKRPGKNIRDTQMHNVGQKYVETDYQLCMNLFYLALTLEDELFLCDETAAKNRI